MTDAPDPDGSGGPRAPTRVSQLRPPFQALSLGNAAEDSPAADVRRSLQDALRDSRQRWHDLVALVADFAFETDAMGRLALVFPDDALGWSASTLLGQPAEFLLPQMDGATGFNPFRVTNRATRRRGWLRRSDGSSACLRFDVAPIIDAEARIIGVRGVAQDMTEQEAWDAATAAALRRGEVLDHIVWRMRQEVLAPRMLHSALEALAQAIGAQGVVVADLQGDRAGPEIMHQIGSSAASVLATARTLLGSFAAEPADDPRSAEHGQTLDGQHVLVCPGQHRYGERIALVLWRDAGARAWDEDDCVLATSATAIVRVILEHDAIQREMARQARTDPLTGLLNRRAFREETERRLDRLEREGLPAALMFVDLDNFKDLNDRCGHDIGDEALCLTASLLRDAVRPTDIVARLGGDEFALWLDGADEFAAAERAEALRLDAPRRLAHLAESGAPPLTMSIGIATRWPGRGEEIESLMLRADQAMYDVKRAGRGMWRVARAEAP